MTAERDPEIQGSPEFKYFDKETSLKLRQAGFVILDFHHGLTLPRLEALGLVDFRVDLDPETDLTALATEPCHLGQVAVKPDSYWIPSTNRESEYAQKEIAERYFNYQIYPKFPNTEAKRGSVVDWLVLEALYSNSHPGESLFTEEDKLIRTTTRTDADKNANIGLMTIRHKPGQSEIRITETKDVVAVPKIHAAYFLTAASIDKS